jgi:hypothetical protein
MERFWGIFERARKGGFSEKLIADIVGALKMTPHAARAAGINWRASNTVISATISDNFIWAPQLQ